MSNSLDFEQKDFKRDLDKKYIELGINSYLIKKFWKFLEKKNYLEDFISYAMANGMDKIKPTNAQQLLFWSIETSHKSIETQNHAYELHREWSKYITEYINKIERIYKSFKKDGLYEKVDNDK